MARIKKKPVTATELMAQLEADPEFVAKRAERDALHASRVAQLREAERPLVQDLVAAGFLVDSLGDLVNMAQSYPAALPVLLRHLERPYPADVRQGIARALGVPDANFAWDTLATLFRDECDPHVKQGLAAALAGAFAVKDLEQLISLVLDPHYGEARGLLLSVLQRSRDPRARATLLELRQDPDLAKEIAYIFRKQDKQAARIAANKSAANKPASTKR